MNALEPASRWSPLSWRQALGAIGLALVGSACGGGGSEPDSTGAVQVVVATSGNASDPDGYTLSVGAATPVVVGVNATRRFADLHPGSYEVVLGGLAAECSVTGANPVTVTVEANATATVEFAIQCAAATGAIRVNATTVGTPAPAAFMLQVDGGTAQALGANGSLDVAGLSLGTHIVTLSGVSPYCSLSGSEVGSRTDPVTVTGDVVTTLNYTVTCQPALRNRLVYARLLEGRLRIVAAHVNGTGEILIGNEPQPTGTFMDVTSDGTKIVYVTGSYPDQKLTVISSLGEPLGDLPTTVCASVPAWSPDGTRLVFDDCSGGGLRIVNADGTGEVALPKPAVLTKARWTPDGQRLVYSRSVGFVSHIAVSNLDGTGEVLLTTAADEWAFDPAISPDGTQVVFARRPTFDGAAELVVVGIDGSGERDLVTNGIYKQQPRWSPDGGRLAYRQDGQNGLPPSFWTVDAAGGTPRIVIMGQGELAFLNWTW